jgi:putative phosphoribosyl transferase
MSFTDRASAGRRLARRLQHLRGEDVVVLALPRGGFPVAAEVADALSAPLDVILVRKLGVPLQPELAMGAVGEGDVLVLNEDVVRRARVGEVELAGVEREARAEIERRARRYRPGRERRSLAGRTALLVDDGIATGATARAACRVAREQGAARVVLAVPVCARDTADRLRGEVDELVCLETPDRFFGVGRCYADFTQVADEDVADLLRRTAPADPPPAAT